MNTTKLREVSDALALIYEGERRLRNLGVLRCNKPVDCQFSEWLAAVVEGGRLAESHSNKGWDVELEDGARVSVKADRKALGSKHRGKFWVFKSQIDELRDQDFVVCIQFAEDRTVEGYYRVPVRDIKSWEPQADDQGPGYRLGERLDAYEQELPPEITGRIAACMHLLPVTVNTVAFDALHAHLGDEAAREGHRTVEDAARELILNGLFGPLEYGEPTPEERALGMQGALVREDLWGSKEDEIWDREGPPDLARS